MPKSDVPEGLTFSIQLALAFNATHWPKKPRRDRGRIEMEDYRALAELIAQHLIRSNWKIEQGPPTPLHSV